MVTWRAGVPATGVAYTAADPPRSRRMRSTAASRTAAAEAPSALTGYDVTASLLASGPSTSYSRRITCCDPTVTVGVEIAGYDGNIAENPPGADATTTHWSVGTVVGAPVVGGAVVVGLAVVGGT